MKYSPLNREAILCFFFGLLPLSALAKLDHWLNGPLPTVLDPGRSRPFVSHFVFNIKSGNVLQTVCRQGTDPELDGSIHDQDICADHGGYCKEH